MDVEKAYGALFVIFSKIEYVAWIVGSFGGREKKKSKSVCTLFLYVD